MNFYREQGFTQNRIDILPGLSTDVLDFGHIVGFTPQVKVREVYYTHGVQNSESQHRETFWAGLDATSKLSRRFGTSEGNTLLHTIEPSVIYEYVPPTAQEKITQIDQVDNLPKKNLMTYMLRNRLLEQDGSKSFNWLDFTMAQSYQVGAVQTQARDFTPGVTPTFGTRDTTVTAGDHGGRGEEIFRSLDAGGDRQHDSSVHSGSVGGCRAWPTRWGCPWSAACH